MTRGLDHLVLAGPDLGALDATYRRLGFQVGARNRHPWGTINHIVQMPGTFLELLSVEPGFARPDDSQPVAQFAGFIDTYLQRGPGFAMLVLQSDDAAADFDRLGRHGLAGPSTFRFERTGRRPDGSPVDVAFTLAFARPAGITDAGFFLCQQHFPQNFWSPALQVHPNGVTSVTAVTLVTEDVERDGEALARFAEADARRVAHGSISIDTLRGCIEVVSPSDAATLYGPASLPRHRRGPYWAGARFGVRSLDAVARLIAAAGFPVDEVGGRLVVPASVVHGVALGFELEGAP